MWKAWVALLVTSAVCNCAPADQAEAGLGPEGGLGPTVAPVEGTVTTARPPHRTLDRKAAELAWRSWLQSPESGAQNAPPRRITTKSLFITPLVCPKGQRLDRDGCVQVVTVEKDEHQRILLEQLNALFTSGPNADILYDYGDADPGPLQLSIPIGLEPQAAPLQANDPAAQPQESQLDFVKLDKKEDKPGAVSSIEAELELLKLQTQNKNKTEVSDKNYVSQSILTNFLPFPDKPKRDSPVINETKTELTKNNTDADVGQKELVYGHVNVDPVLYYQNEQPNITKTAVDTNLNKSVELVSQTIQLTQITQNDTINTNNRTTTTEVTSKITSTEKNIPLKTSNNDRTEVHELKKDADGAKLNPENDYSDIGEAIKIISRYAEVTTDDNFSKDQKKLLSEIDDSILGTRTKLQHRRNKLKPLESQGFTALAQSVNRNNGPHNAHQYLGAYYRYPIPGPAQTPPSNYPFRHVQDYWPDRNQFGGVYNSAHENHRRHHHSYYDFKPHGAYINPFLPYQDPYPRSQELYPGKRLGPPPHYLTSHHTDPNLRTDFKDLYSYLASRPSLSNAKR